MVIAKFISDISSNKEILNKNILYYENTLKKVDKMAP